MEPDTNLYSPNENNEIIRENSQKKLCVLAAHQIALWEYDYFRTLGLKEAGWSLKALMTFTISHTPEI